MPDCFDRCGKGHPDCGWHLLPAIQLKRAWQKGDHFYLLLVGLPFLSLLAELVYAVVFAVAAVTAAAGGDDFHTEVKFSICELSLD